MPRDHQPSTRRRVVRWVVLLGLLLVVALAVVMGLQALTAYRNLHAASQQLKVMQAQLVGGDADGAARSLSIVQTRAGKADDALSGPHWALAAHLPLVGQDIAAARTVSHGVDAVAGRALPELLSAAKLAYAKPQSISGGTIDLGPIAAAAPHLARARDALAQVDRADAGIEVGSLNARLRTPVGQFVDTVARTHRAAASATDAARLLPPMLGQDGPRNYLILPQNSAEQRTLGGIPGSITLLHADHGRLQIKQIRSNSSLSTYPRPALPLSVPEVSLYGPELGTFIQEVTDAPTFPRAAELAKAMWERHVGGPVDGVLAVDPYALQLIVKVTGPVAAPDKHTLNGDDTATVMLHQIYDEYADPDQQDAFFAGAGRAVFDKLSQGQFDRKAMLEALATAVSQHRLFLWSAHPDEQRVIGATTLGGVWPTPASAGGGSESGSGGSAANTVGVFLHDRTQSKMSWYQRVQVRTTDDCRARGRSAHVIVTVRSVAPRDRKLPAYVTGGRFDQQQVRRGDMLTQLDVAAPPGWTVQGLKASDGNDALTTVKQDGSWFGSRYLTLQPGASQTLDFTLSQESGSRAPLAVRTTPGALPDHVSIDRPQCF